MSYKYDPSAWVDGVTIPHVIDYQNIAADIRAYGNSQDGAGYGHSNLGFLILKGGELPGATYGVTAAVWSSNTVTLTIGTHAFSVGQHIQVSGITPSAFNVADAPITAIAATTISYQLAANPGTYTSGGTVIAGVSGAAEGMLAASPAFNPTVYLYANSKWQALGTGSGTGTTMLGNVNAAGYGTYSQSFLGFKAGALPGTQYSVTSGSWTGNVATLTIGSHNIAVGQHVSISNISPLGYNSGDAVVTSVTGTQISYSVTTNPGAYTGGGTVGVDLLSGPSLGMMALAPSGILQYYNGSSWVVLGVGLTDPTTTRGDLIVRGAVAPPTRLGIGADGTVLIADSAQALNMRWGTITLSGLGGVPSTRQVLAGSGMTGGGTLANDVTLNANVISVCGHTGAVQLAVGDITNAVPNTRQIKTPAGSGLTGGGQLTGDVTLQANVISVNGYTGNVVLGASDIAGIVPTSRKINTGYGLAGGGDLTADRTLSVLDQSSIQNVGILFNGSNVRARSYLNFIQAGNILLTIQDNPSPVGGGQPRVDVTISTASAATTTVAKTIGGTMTVVGTAPILNLIPGSNMSMTFTDNSQSTSSIDVVFSAAGGTGGGGSQTPWASDIDAASFNLYDLTSINALGSVKKLGIGVTAPTSILDVAAPTISGRTNITFTNPAAASAANGLRLRLGPSLNFQGTDLYPYIEALGLDTTGTAAIGIGSYNGTSLLENMRLVPTANGQVYIGTTTPLSAGGVVSGGNERLHVSGQGIVGNTTVAAAAALSTSQPVLCVTDTNNPTGYLSVQQNASTGAHSAAVQLWANGSGWLIANQGNLDSSTAPTMNRLAVFGAGTELFSIYTTGLAIASSLQSKSGLTLTGGSITFPDSSVQSTAFLGKAASQTPWLQDVDAANHNLLHLNTLNPGAIATPATLTIGGNISVQSTSTSTGASILLASDGANNAGFNAQAFSGAATNYGGAFSGYSARGSMAAPTPTQANDAIAGLNAYGFSGGNWVAGASITTWAEAAWTTTSTPTFMVFNTCPSGSISIAERMRITGSGNVGIGTANPTANLAIWGAGTGNRYYTDGDPKTLRLVDTGVGVNSGGSIIFGAAIGDYAGIKGCLLNGTGPAGCLVFQTRTTVGNIVERMCVDYDGNVGIGTTVPLNTLSIITANPTTPAAANQFTIGEASNNSAYRLNVGFYYDVPANTYKGVIQATNSGPSTGVLLLQPSGGNVGIGMTSPLMTLHVNGPVLISGVAAPSVTSPSSASLDFYSGNARWISHGPDTVTLGGFQFISVHSDNSGATFPFCITAAGNVGIGTTSPAARIHSIAAAANYDPSLTYGSAADYIFNDAGGAEIAMAVASASPYAWWIQARGSNNAGWPLAINPVGGNVGIGTTSPVALLNVKYGSTVDSSGQPGGTFAAIVYNATNASGLNGLLVKNNWAGSDATILEVGNDYVGGAYKSYLHVGGAGNVGIGNSAPGSTLTVSGTAIGSIASSIFAVGGPALSATANSEVILGSFGLSTPNASYLSISAFRTSATNTWGTNDFIIGMNVDVYQRVGGWLTISGTGNIGIKKLTPAYALDVTGDVNCTGAFRVNGTPFTGGAPGAWTAYTPTVTDNVGTAMATSTLTAHYVVFGSILFIQIVFVVTMTANSSTINFTLPVTAVADSNNVTCYAAWGAGTQNQAVIATGTSGTSIKITMGSFSNGASLQIYVGGSLRMS